MSAARPDARADARADAQTDVSIAVMIPTLNEAGHIAEAVTNAAQLGTVFVLDSFSTDGTQELARAAGAIVVERRFTDYADQKNWGLDNLPFQSDWVFILDADERVPPKLRAEIKTRLAEPDTVAGFYVNRLMLFMGTTIRHGGFYPSWNLRLFRRGAARYENRSVHEHMICSGPTAYLREEMLHIRNETMQQFIAKHVRYAELEANEWVKLHFGSSNEARASALFTDLLRYRQYLRRVIWPQMPLRPLWRFLYMYFLRLGVVDGAAGWRLARLMCTYEFMISVLYQEQLLAEQRLRRMRKQVVD